MKQLNIKEFKKLYPTEKACLDEIFDRVYGDLLICPGCETETKWNHVFFIFQILSAPTR